MRPQPHPGAQKNPPGKGLRSPCCGAPVVGSVLVPVHPHIFKDRNGATYDGPLVDIMRVVRHNVAQTEPSEHSEAFCWACGNSVDVEAL